LDSKGRIPEYKVHRGTWVLMGIRETKVTKGIREILARKEKTPALKVHKETLDTKVTKASREAKVTLVHRAKTPEFRETKAGKGTTPEAKALRAESDYKETKGAKGTKDIKLQPDSSTDAESTMQLIFPTYTETCCSRVMLKITTLTATTATQLIIQE
jgi:hypothetical protein